MLTESVRSSISRRRMPPTRSTRRFCPTSSPRTSSQSPKPKKTKEPKIEWHWATRSGEGLAELLVKTNYVGREIADGRFYKRPGKWCSWCDYLPVGVEDEKRAK